MSTRDILLCGRYVRARSCLDYSWHKPYPPDRQLLQDAIVSEELNDKPSIERPWLYLMAGTMGAGKTHSIKKWLGRDVFRNFVLADIDRIKHRLPEMKQLLEDDPRNADKIVHSEASTVHEVLFRTAIDKRNNVIIDGTLRDGKFFESLLNTWKGDEDIPHRIVIFHVVASLNTCLRRAIKRGGETKRIVPPEYIDASISDTEIAIRRLRYLADEYVVIHNDADDT